LNLSAKGWINKHSKIHSCSTSRPT